MDRYNVRFIIAETDWKAMDGQKNSWAPAEIKFVTDY